MSWRQLLAKHTAHMLVDRAMDVLGLGCTCRQIPSLKVFLDIVGHMGRGITGPLIGLAFLGYGYYKGDPKSKKVGWAILISLAITGIVINVLKYALQMPRPTPRSGYGFPSGDSGAAFALATVIGTAFPSLSAASFLLAILTAISRLYFRAHFTWDVVGGALIGIVTAHRVLRKFQWIRTRPLPRSPWNLATWTASALLAVGALFFFFFVENKIAQHKLPNNRSASTPPPITTIDFGTEQGKQFLSHGWSENKIWQPGHPTLTWVEGLEASLKLPLDEPGDYSLRFRAYPYRPQGFRCQWINVTINEQFVEKFYLEQDWNEYEVRAAKNIFRAGGNKIDLAFAYADTLNWHGVNPARKPLSVAFDFLHIVPQAKR